jgi:HD-like signal output (HDOD) protein
MHPELDFDIPPPANPGPKGLAGWVAHIREQDMPAFGNTVEAVRGIVVDERASASRLAGVILRDQAMTTKILRLANSAYFHASHQGVSTISRAIVVLGFDVVADMAVGLALIDGLLSRGVRARVTEEMARSFFAATLARGLARMRGEGNAEEVFIAALLSRVGEMAFWCFGGEQADTLDAALPAKCADDAAQAVQQAVLGFRLRQLTVQLAREWRLGSLLQEVLEPVGRDSPLVEAIRHGQSIARAVDAGWDSPAMRAMLVQVAAFVHLPVEELYPQIQRLAREAADLAADYGASEAARAIPVPVDAPVEPAAAVEPPEALSPAERQLHILRELSMLILSGAGFPEVTCLACEGILQGVGFDRVIVAQVSAQRREVVGKYALGRGAEALSRRFVFALGHGAEDPVDQVVASHQPVRGECPTGRLAKVAAGGGYCLAPVLGQGRVVGLVFAERDAVGPIDDASHFAMAHFVQHMSMALQNGRSGER